jgi:hypothetical protein
MTPIAFNPHDEDPRNEGDNEVVPQYPVAASPLSRYYSVDETLRRRVVTPRRLPIIFNQDFSITGELPQRRHDSCGKAQSSHQTFHHEKLHLRRGKYVQPLYLSSSLYVNSGSTPQPWPQTTPSSGNTASTTYKKGSMRDRATQQAKGMMQCFRSRFSNTMRVKDQDPVEECSVASGVVFVDEAARKKTPSFMRRMFGVHK